MGLLPVASAQRTQPSENTSLRASTSPPIHCSGDMYSRVPLATPASVRCSRSRAKAMPKSLSLTSPSYETRMLAAGPRDAAPAGGAAPEALGHPAAPQAPPQPIAAAHHHQRSRPRVSVGSVRILGMNKRAALVMTVLAAASARAGEPARVTLI